MKLLVWTVLSLAIAACGRPADAASRTAVPDPAGLDTNPPAAAALAAVAPATLDLWQVVADTSPMDGTVTRRLATISDGRAPGAGYAAMLFLQCAGPKLDVFIATDDVLDWDASGVPMRVRVDSAPAHAETWLRSADDRGAFAPSPRALIAKLSSAHRLLLEIPVYSKGRQVAAWSLDGLSNHVADLPCVKP